MHIATGEERAVEWLQIEQVGVVWMRSGAWELLAVDKRRSVGVLGFTYALALRPTASRCSNGSAQRSAGGKPG